MTITLYNDLTRSKEVFEPCSPGKVTFYSCGPTVYDFFHIGNARPFIVFDVLRRYFEASGFEVVFVQNFTDIDDKMIKRAAEMGVTVKELADKYIEEYYRDADALGIHRPTIAPRATDHIGEIIEMVSALVEKGHAYENGGDVFFHVSSFSSYGALSKQTLEELQSGARIDINPRKKHPLDFVLWKAKKQGEPSWPSPWGEGRPGWHIECSAMSMKYLGETIDIHSGGSDLVFPHHENEIAQAEGATGKQFVRFWIHNGYLLIDQEKMSKSRGNFLTTREARKKFNPLAIRLFMLGAHYRSPLSFSAEGIQQASRGAERLRNCLFDLQSVEPCDAPADAAFIETLENFRMRFKASMDDDFNTAGAIGALFESVRLTNQKLASGGIAFAEKESALSILEYADGILGVIGDIPDRAADSDPRIEEMVASREVARQQKNFAEADRLRGQLLELGVVVEDTASGPRWKFMEGDAGNCGENN